MYQEVSHAVPMVCVDIQIFHATPQARLEDMGIPPEQPHNNSPAQSGEYWPCIVGDLISKLAGNHNAMVYYQTCKTQYHPTENIDDNLLIDRGLYASSKNRVSSYQSSQERIMTWLLLIGCYKSCRMSQHKHTSFVEEDKGSKVLCMSFGRFQHEAQLFAYSP